MLFPSTYITAVSIQTDHTRKKILSIKHNTNQPHCEYSIGRQFGAVVINAGFRVKLPEFTSWLYHLVAV